MTKDGCYQCTGFGHISSKCEFKVNCQKCQSPTHHDSICGAAENLWKSVKEKKWEKPAQMKKPPTPLPRKSETEVKKSFLVKGEDLQEE